MSRATVILRSGDEPTSVGTVSGGFLGSERCTACGATDLTWVPDSLYGGGWDVCGRCRYQVKVAIRRATVSDAPAGRPRRTVEFRRARILAVLREQGPCGIGRVARTAGMNHADAKPCLEALTREGLLVEVSSRSIEGYIGRPTVLYAIAEPAP